MNGHLSPPTQVEMTLVLHWVRGLCHNAECSIFYLAKESIMGMRGRKRRDRRKKAANHGKRPNT